MNVSFFVYMSTVLWTLTDFLSQGDECLFSTYVFHLTGVLTSLSLLRWHCELSSLLEGSIPIGQRLSHIHILMHLYSISLQGDIHRSWVESSGVAHHRRRWLLLDQRHFRGDWRKKGRRLRQKRKQFKDIADMNNGSSYALSSTKRRGSCFNFPHVK